MSNSPFSGAAPSAMAVLVFVFAILGLHVLAIFQGWYLTYKWIDIPLHLAGGAWVALAFFYVQRKHVLLFSALPFWFSLIAAVGVVMLVGVMWEWLEYGFDYFFVPEHALWRAQLGLVDTMGDLFSDFMGGIAMGLYFLTRRKSIFVPTERESFPTIDNL